MSKKLVKLLIKKNILKHGIFILKSGEKSNFYSDIKESFGDTEILTNIVYELTKLIPDNTTCVAASGYGGITLASLISYKKKIPLILIRDNIKHHGTKKIIEG